MTPCYFPQIDMPSIAAWLDGLPDNGMQQSVFALLPEAEIDRLPDLQFTFNKQGIGLLGAVFPALVTAAGFQTHGVVFLHFKHSPYSFLADGLDTDPALAARKIADAALGALEENPTWEKPQLFLIFDSMLPSIGSILVGLFGRLEHRFSYAGVNAGSERFQPMPCLFDNQRVISNGVIGIVLEEKTHVAIQHGYPVSKTLMRASSTTGNRIDKIDGQPAMNVYQQVIASEFGIALTPENFYDYAVHYPFGLIGSLEVLVRIPVAFGEDGSIICVGEVPPNSMLRLLRAPALAESPCVGKLAEILGSVSPKHLLAFYCAGRRMHFGAAAETEIRQLLSAFGTNEVFGALSLGEISTDIDLGIPEFHNAALICIR